MITGYARGSRSSGTWYWTYMPQAETWPGPGVPWPLAKVVATVCAFTKKLPCSARMSGVRDMAPLEV